MQIPVSRPINAISVPASQQDIKPAAPAEAERVVAPAPVAEGERVSVTNIVQTQEAIAEQVSRYLQTSARNLEFQVDADSATPVIIVRDGAGNVIRRIPGEEALQMLRLANAQSGTFVNSTA